jgi:hypothetical protein
VTEQGSREEATPWFRKNFTHFDNIVAVEGNQVRLLPQPEELVFVSAKTTSPTAAPWLRL